MNNDSQKTTFTGSWKFTTPLDKKNKKKLIRLLTVDETSKSNLKYNEEENSIQCTDITIDFHKSVEWLKNLLQLFLLPEGYTVEGTVHFVRIILCKGREYVTRGEIIVFDDRDGDRMDKKHTEVRGIEYIYLRTHDKSTHLPGHSYVDESYGLHLHSGPPPPPDYSESDSDEEGPSYLFGRGKVLKPAGSAPIMQPILPPTPSPAKSAFTPFQKKKKTSYYTKKTNRIYKLKTLEERAMFKKNKKISENRKVADQLERHLKQLNKQVKDLEAGMKAQEDGLERLEKTLKSNSDTNNNNNHEEANEEEDDKEETVEDHSSFGEIRTLG